MVTPADTKENLRKVQQLRETQGKEEEMLKIGTVVVNTDLRMGRGFRMTMDVKYILQIKLSIFQISLK